MVFASVDLFLDFQLPNATTWFYFSWLLAIALFFKFGRILSVRNLDVITLFLLTPGILLVQGSRPTPTMAEGNAPIAAASLASQLMPGTLPVAGVVQFQEHQLALAKAQRWMWIGYLWLLCGSAFFLCRCVWDLTLVQRPVLNPNLNFGGLGWLALTLFACLMAVGFRQQVRSAVHLPAPPALENGAKQPLGPNGPPVGQESVSLTLARDSLELPDSAYASFAMLGHLSVVLGLFLFGKRHFKDVEAGMAAAACYLLMPYTGFFVGHVHHVWPAALILWALVWYTQPTLAGLLLGIAAGAFYFPALLLPLWLSFYRERGMGRFLVAFLVGVMLSLGTSLLILSWQNMLAPTIQHALASASWQPWKVPTTESFWTGIPWAYRIPVFLAYGAFLVFVMFWPKRKNLGHLLAMSTSLLIGVQFWYAEQGGLYVLWYLPMLLLVLFRPNLEDRMPLEITAQNDWLLRLRQTLVKLVRKILRLPEYSRSGS